MGHISPISMKVASTLAAYRIVKVSAAQTAAYPASAADVPIGITQDTVKDTNNDIPISGPGNISKLTFNDTVAAGGLVASDNAGFGVPHLNVTAGSYVIGVLVGPAVTATGTVAEVLIQPMFKSIP
jgi:hypothetical protein